MLVYIVERHQLLDHYHIKVDIEAIYGNELQALERKSDLAQSNKKSNVSYKIKCHNVLGKIGK